MKLRIAIIILILALGATAFAQDKKAEVRAMVTSKQYIFKAQTALPTTGRSRQLTGVDYDLRIANDSAISYLPYFGRAYSLPYGGDDGLKFTSTKFDYQASERMKGGWEISIKPKDVNDIRELTLTISENGYANLNVITNNRQPISYSGYITNR